MPARVPVFLVVAATATALLTSCSLFNPGPPRNADGEVTEPTVTASQYLAVGDCFSFVDDADYAKVEVTPCGLPHTHTVIGQGTLPQDDIDEAGGLQNAVSAACSDAFATFKEAAAEGSKPEQEFIVAMREVEGEQVAAYSCVATDAAAA